MAQNTLLNILGQVLPLLINLVAVPVAIRSLGASQFGVFSLLSVILGVSALFDFGLARAVVKFAAGAVERQDYTSVGRIVGCTVWVQFLMGIVAAILVWLLAPLLTDRFFNIPPEHLQNARLSVAIMGLGIPLVLVSGSYRGLLEAAQRFDLVNLLRLVGSSTVYAAPIIGALLGWELVGITALIVGARALYLALHWFACVRLIPGYLGIPRFDQEQLSKLVGFSGWVALSNAISPFQYHVDRMMLAGLLPIAAVSYYSVPYEVVTALCLLPASLAMSIFPVVSILAENRRHEIFKLFFQSAELLMILMSLTSYTLINCAPLIFTIWISPQFAEVAAPVAQILAFGLLPTSINLVGVVLFQGVARPDVVAKQQLIRFPVMCVLSWALIAKFGLTGAALSWCLAQTLTTAMYCWSMRHVLQWNYRDMSSRRIAVALGVLICLVVAIDLLSELTAARALQWRGCWAVGGLIVQIGVSWRWLLTSEERQWVLAKMRRCLPA